MSCRSGGSNGLPGLASTRSTLGGRGISTLGRLVRVVLDARWCAADPGMCRCRQHPIGDPVRFLFQRIIARRLLCACAATALLFLAPLALRFTVRAPAAGARAAPQDGRLRRGCRPDGGLRDGALAHRVLLPVRAHHTRSVRTPTPRSVGRRLSQ